MLNDPPEFDRITVRPQILLRNIRTDGWSTRRRLLRQEAAGRPVVFDARGRTSRSTRRRTDRSARTGNPDRPGTRLEGVAVRPGGPHVGVARAAAIRRSARRPRPAAG